MDYWIAPDLLHFQLRLSGQVLEMWGNEAELLNAKGKVAITNVLFQ